MKDRPLTYAVRLVFVTERIQLFLTGGNNRRHCGVRVEVVQPTVYQVVRSSSAIQYMYIALIHYH